MTTLKEMGSSKVVTWHHCSEISISKWWNWRKCVKRGTERKNGLSFSDLVLWFLWMLWQFHRQDLSLLLQWFIDWHFALPPNKHTPLTFSLRSDTEPTLSIIWDVLVCPQGSVYGVQYNWNTRMRERKRRTEKPSWKKTSLNQTKVVCRPWSPSYFHCWGQSDIGMQKQYNSGRYW